MPLCRTTKLLLGLVVGIVCLMSLSLAGNAQSMMTKSNKQTGNQTAGYHHAWPRRRSNFVGRKQRASKRFRVWKSLLAFNAVRLLLTVRHIFLTTSS